jgi:hypothetical protein
MIIEICIFLFQSPYFTFFAPVTAKSRLGGDAKAALFAAQEKGFTAGYWNYCVR